jgi:hypothetical protein
LAAGAGFAQTADYICHAEDPTAPIKPLHKMSEAQVRKEAALLPLPWVETIEKLPRQRLFIFQKRHVSADPDRPRTSGAPIPGSGREAASAQNRREPEVLARGRSGE